MRGDCGDENTNWSEHDASNTKDAGLIYLWTIHLRGRLDDPCELLPV